MTTTDFLKSQLAIRAFRDGGSEGLNGMLAVAFCFRNRVRAGWWNGKWASVLENFRDVDYRLEVDDKIMPNPESNYSFFLLLQQIDGVFDGSTPDNITMAQDSLPSPLTPEYNAPVCLYYARLSEISNPFFLENISRNTEQHRVIAQTGGLHFFS